MILLKLLKLLKQQRFASLPALSFVNLGFSECPVLVLGKLSVA
jgi:hypothetical protein